MIRTTQQYIDKVRDTLKGVLCLHNVPGIQPEHPETELPSSPELTLPHITIEKSPTECCFIEPTINSARINLRLKQTDELEKWLTKRWLSLLTQAAYAEV